MRCESNNDEHGVALRQPLVVKDHGSVLDLISERDRDIFDNDGDNYVVVAMAMEICFVVVDMKI